MKSFLKNAVFFSAGSAFGLSVSPDLTRRISRRISRLPDPAWVPYWVPYWFPYWFPDWVSELVDGVPSALWVFPVSMTYLMYRGIGLSDIVYATRSQVSALSSGLSGLKSALLQRVGLLEEGQSDIRSDIQDLHGDVKGLHGDHRSLSHLVRGIDSKVANIELLSLFSTKGVSVLCDIAQKTQKNVV